MLSTKIHPWRISTVWVVRAIRVFCLGQWPRIISNYDLLAQCQQGRPSSPGSDGAGLGTCCTRMPTPSPKSQSTGPQKESGSVVDWRQPVEELWKQKWRRWTTAGAQARGWPVTDRGGGASLLPYSPAGVMGSDGADDVHCSAVLFSTVYKTRLWLSVLSILMQC